MNNFRIGDTVLRKSYGGDVSFRIVRIIHERDKKPVYVLRGILHRLLADSDGSDLVRQNTFSAYLQTQREINKAKRYGMRDKDFPFLPFLRRVRGKPGRILQIDSSSDYLNKCISYYSEAGLKIIGRTADENKQPTLVRSLLERYKPDILVVTGHDGLKKSSNSNLIESYRNSKYFIMSVREARKYQPSPDKLCIFAGACQSYFEAIMEAGANFASSPGRILINAIDPAIVGRKIAVTDSKIIVTPAEIALLTISGSKGIGGVRTRGRLIM
jgi:spore coat assembly protein